jgi:signal transduction histidine kinase
MISGLRPPIIDEQGVAGAVDYLVSEFNARGMAIRFTHDMPTDRLFPDLETAIFRIVQEALANVERHSQSKLAEVHVGQRDGTIRIVVRDCGVGFDPDSVAEGHFGLEGIRERARLAGGSASVQSAKGKGTEVVVELPALQPTRREE